MFENESNQKAIGQDKVSSFLNQLPSKVNQNEHSPI